MATLDDNHPMNTSIHLLDHALVSEKPWDIYDLGRDFGDHNAYSLNLREYPNRSTYNSGTVSAYMTLRQLEQMAHDILAFVHLQKPAAQEAA